MDDAAATLGLFPLGLVVLPGESVPLHIFEARYKRLIASGRDGESEFGIVSWTRRASWRSPAVRWW